MTARTRACPTCKAPISDPETNQALPFCSPKCKLVDLGRWLDGAYRIPGAPSPDAHGSYESESGGVSDASSDEEPNVA
jgi:uncharacterized protein